MEGCGPGHRDDFVDLTGLNLPVEAADQEHKAYVPQLFHDANSNISG
jgi:hypothetical protein